MPRVSVIIPNYNHARYLPRRLSSVVDQSFRDVEILFLDDKSTDLSREVFTNHPAAADPRVRSIFNTENSGSTFKQWNRGFRAAQGEYIWLAESDDYADEALLSELVARLDANPQAGMAYCQSMQVDSEDQILTSCRVFTDELDPDHWTADFVANGREECAKYLIHQNIVPNASAVLLRRSVLDRVGDAPEDMRICGDWMMWVRMMLAADVAFVARPLNYFRTHTGNVRTSSARTGLNLEETCRVRNEIARVVKLSPDKRKYIAQTMAWTWLADTQGEHGGNVPWSRHLRLFRAMARMNFRSASPIVALALGQMLAERLKVRNLLRRVRGTQKPKMVAATPIEQSGRS